MARCRRPVDEIDRPLEPREPENTASLTTLGIAQHRLGQDNDALTTLLRAEKLNGDSPGEVAFLAMTYQRLGQGDNAQACMARMRQCVAQARWAADAEAAAFLQEAEEVCKGRK